jgi:ankyrin repeat protein
MKIIRPAFVAAAVALGVGYASPRGEITEDPMVEAAQQAAFDCGVGTLQRLLDSKPALASAPSKADRKTPLHVAAYAGCTEAVLLLLRYTSEIDPQDKFGGTPLLGAAYSGHTELVRLLIDREANKDALDHDGNSIVDGAADQLQCATAAFLMERGAGANGGRSGFFPGNRFVRVGDAECVSVFIAHGANVNRRDWSGFNAAHWVAKGRYVSKEESLGAKLYLGYEVPRPSSGPSRYQETFDLLVTAGADLNARNNLKGTPLHVAAAAGNHIIAEVLVAAGVDINAREKEERTPLFFAVEKGHTDIVSLLLSRKADVNARDRVGFTPLIVAIRWGEQKEEIGEIVRLLLDGGADANARRPGGGWGPAGSDGETALQQAAESGYARVVALLIRRGADVNAEFKDGRTPLYWAARNGHTDVVAMLIRNGANVNANARGRSALKGAIEGGRDEIYQLLLKNGARE